MAATAFVDSANPAGAHLGDGLGAPIAGDVDEAQVAEPVHALAPTIEALALDDPRLGLQVDLPACEEGP